jgi:hypothetical protein
MKFPRKLQGSSLDLDPAAELIDSPVSAFGYTAIDRAEK